MSKEIISVERIAQAEKPRREIGFHVRADAARYRTRERA
jgi:hypothetical protein